MPRGGSSKPSVKNDEPESSIASCQVSTITARKMRVYPLITRAIHTNTRLNRPIGPYSAITRSRAS